LEYNSKIKKSRVYNDKCSHGGMELLEKTICEVQKTICGMKEAYTQKITKWNNYFHCKITLFFSK